MAWIPAYIRMLDREREEAKKRKEEAEKREKETQEDLKKLRRMKA